jgi:hypothetical protein
MHAIEWLPGSGRVGMECLVSAGFQITAGAAATAAFRAIRGTGRSRCDIEQIGYRGMNLAQAK